MNNIEAVCSIPMSLLCKALIERKLHREGNIFKWLHRYCKSKVDVPQNH